MAVKKSESKNKISYIRGLSQHRSSEQFSVISGKERRKNGMVEVRL